MSPEEQEEFIRQKTQIVNEYKKQQEKLINEQYKLSDEKNIEAEKQRIRMQIKSSENNSRLELQKLKRQKQIQDTQHTIEDSHSNTPKSAKSQNQQYQQSKFSPEKKDKNTNNNLQVQGNKGGLTPTILGQIDASESQYITNNEQTVSPKSGVFKNMITEDKSPNSKNHNVDYKANVDAPIRQYNGVLSQDQDESEQSKPAEVFGKIEQYVYKPPTTRSISPNRELLGNNGEQMNTSPDNSTKLNKSYNIKQRDGTNSSFLSKGKYSLFQQNNSQNIQSNSNPFIIQETHHNQNVSFPQKQLQETQKTETQVQMNNQKSNKPQQQLSQEKVPQILIKNTYLEEQKQIQQPVQSNQFVQNAQNQQHQKQNNNEKIELLQQDQVIEQQNYHPYQEQSKDNQRVNEQKLDPSTISLSKNQKERSEQQQQYYGDDLIKENGQSEKDLNAIQEDTKENISSIYNNSGSNIGGILSPYSRVQVNQAQQLQQQGKYNSKNQQMLTNNNNISQQQQQQQEFYQYNPEDNQANQQNNGKPQQKVGQNIKNDQLNSSKQGNPSGYKVETFQQNHNSNYTPQQNQPREQNQNSFQSEQALQQQQQVKYLQLQDNSQTKKLKSQGQKQNQQPQQQSDVFKTEAMISNISGTNQILNSQQDFTIQNKYDQTKEIFNSLLQFSNVDIPFQSNIKMKVYNLQNSNPIDLDWTFDTLLQNNSPITPILFQGKCLVKDNDSSSQRKSTFISYNYNASNLRKEYFKDVHIMYQINKEFRQNRENTPTPILLSLPVGFEISKNQLEIICETSRFVSMSEMIKRRKQQSGQIYNENELAFIFHSILRCIQVIEKKGILHSYLTPDNLVYCVESSSYKISNFSLSQTFSASDISRNKRPYNIYYQFPFISNESKSSLGTKTQVPYTPFYADRYALAISFFCIQQLIEPTEANSNVINRAIKLMENKNDQSSISSQIILMLLNCNKSVQSEGNQFWDNIFQTLDGVQHIQPNDEEIASISVLNLNEQQTNYQPNVEYRSEQALRMLADQYYITFQFSKSLEFYLTLLQMQQQKYGKDDENLMPTLNKIWKIFFSDNDFQNSYIYCSQYTHLARVNYNKQKQLNQQQNQQQLQNKNDSQQNTESLSAFNKLQRNLVSDFNLSGQLKWQLDKQKEAIQDYEMALQLQIEIYGENEYNVIKNLNNIGVYYSNINEIDKAIEIISQAVNKMEQQSITDHLYTSALYNLGNLLSDNGQLSEALPYLTKSYEIKKKTLGNNQEVGKLAHLIGTLHFQLKNYPQSLLYLEEAVLISQKFQENDDAELIKYRRNYIVSLLKNNQHQQANAQIEQILQSLEQSTFKTYSESPGQVFYELGGFFEKILKNEYALVCYEKSATYWQQMEINDTDPSLAACLSKIRSLKSKKDSQIEQKDSGIRQQQIQENIQNSKTQQLQKQQNNDQKKIDNNEPQAKQSQLQSNDSIKNKQQNLLPQQQQQNQSQQKLNELTNVPSNQQTNNEITQKPNNTNNSILTDNQTQNNKNINENDKNNSVNGLIPTSKIPVQQQSSNNNMPKLEHLTQIPQEKKN